MIWREKIIMYKYEQERKHYNKKLLDEGVKNELKKSHRFDWKTFIIVCIGDFLGIILWNTINVEKYISNQFGRFFIEVLFLVAAISAVDGVVRLFNKFKNNKNL